MQSPIRPSEMMKPEVFRDGNQICALHGDNLQDGVSGFGDTEELALLDFDARWIAERGAISPSTEPQLNSKSQN